MTARELLTLKKKSWLPTAYLRFCERPDKRRHLQQQMVNYADPGEHTWMDVQLVKETTDAERV